MPCARKPLLQDRLRSLSSTSEPLLYGNLLHELFQTCLAAGNWSEDFRRAEVTKICAFEETICSAWELDRSVTDLINTVLERSGGWQNWADTFVGEEPEPDAALTDPRGSIEEGRTVCLSAVHDIEEDIWSPRLGLKGKIDVSVQARVEGASASAEERTEVGVVAPFEIKTGRSTGVMEHRAQTMLYTLLMSDRYSQWYYFFFLNLESLMHFCRSTCLKRIALLHAKRTGYAGRPNEERAAWLDTSSQSASGLRFFAVRSCLRQSTRCHGRQRR